MLAETVRFQFKRTEIVLLRPEQVRSVREGYTAELRHDFRRQALASLNREDRARFLRLSPLEVHHVLPVQYGGSNCVKNMVLLPRIDHQAAHDEIEMQTYGMDYGERRVIELPFFQHFTWGLQ